LGKETEIDLAKSLMKLFFHAPAAHGLIIFEDNDYLGVVLKRDIEIGIMEGRFSLYENISMIKISQLSQTLFKSNTTKNVQVPVIDKTGALLRIISYDEFQCQFYFDEYIPHFKILGVIDDMEHPFVITNHFKKTIYANRQALELIQRDIEGKIFSEALKRFEIKNVGDFMRVINKDSSYNLIISHSESRNFSYYVYIFLKI
jgi:hypothetical protein